MIPSAQDQERITQAVRRAEEQTSGEVFVVVARAAEQHRLVGTFWAAVASLVIGAVLHLFTPLSDGLAVLVQAIAFVSLSVALSIEDVRYRIVPPMIADSAVEAAARAQFLAHGLHLTERRTGVLIYAALAERRVEIVADAAISPLVPQAEWDAIADDVALAAREGRLVEGLIAAIDHAALHLARYFPPRGEDDNEIPDHVVVM